MGGGGWCRGIIGIEGRVGAGCFGSSGCGFGDFMLDMLKRNVVTFY